MSEDGLTANQRHYRKNKDSISQERKERYQKDKEYREEQIRRRREYTEKKRLEEGRAPLEEVPPQYTHTIADIIGDPPIIGRSTISGWVAKGQLPEPAKFNNVYYFTKKQADILADFVTKVAGRKRIFTSGEFDADIQAVRDALN